MANKDRQQIDEVTDFFDSLHKHKNLPPEKAQMWLQGLLEEGTRKKNKNKPPQEQRQSLKNSKATVRQVSQPRVGRMYQYKYSAKTAKNLPYWDKYPLMICLAVSPAGMLGINLHYIPKKQRQEFLEVVMKYKSAKVISDKSYLRINYNKIKNFRWVNVMIKQYLFSHVKSRILEINPKDWGIVINLDTQKFVKRDTNKRVSTQKVYTDSRSKM